MEVGSGDSGGALAHLKQKYRTLLQGIPDAVFMVDCESGEILDANRAAYSLLEVSGLDLIGRHQFALHPPKEIDAYASLFQGIKNRVGSGNTVFRSLPDGSPIHVVADTGERVPVEIRASIVDFQGHDVFVGIYQHRRTRPNDARESETEAEQVNAADGVTSALLANVSHEIRTPLTSIIGFSKILTQTLQGEAGKHARKIYDAGQYLMKTVHSILELSKLKSGAVEIERRSVRLDRVAEWAVDLLKSQARKKKVDVVMEELDAPVQALGNREALNRIAENLIENAIKFTPSGGRVTVRVSEDDEAVMEVEDTGIGMEPETVTSLFEPFTQGSQGLDREYEGSGLGLSIVRELTNRHNGMIEVQTRKGEGSRFTVHLPRPPWHVSE